MLKKLCIKICYISILITFLTCPIYAVNLTPQNNLIVLKNATIIDGTGRDPITHAIMIIQGDQIKTVTGNSYFPIPKSAKVFDETGKTIIPALIDTHVHLGLTKGTSASPSNITVANDLHQLQRFAEYGVGAVLSLGKDEDFIYDLRAKRNIKEIGGSYILTAGRGFGVPNGAPPDSPMVYRPENLQQVKMDMDELANHHPDIVKLWMDDWHGKLPKMNSNIIQAVIDEAHKRGLKVAAHIYYLADAKMLAKDHVDILEHSIRDLRVDEELVSLMKRNNVAIVPTLDLSDAKYIYKEKPRWMNTQFFKESLDPGVWEMFNSPTYQANVSEKQILALSEKNIKTLYDGGVKIGFGTDAGALPERIQGFAEHRELELLVNAGLSPMQAIQIATLDSAHILGIDKKMGSLQTDKLANFIILDKNPLDNISNTQLISSVWLDGHIVSKGPLKQ